MKAVGTQPKANDDALGFPAVSSPAELLEISRICCTIRCPPGVFLLSWAALYPYPQPTLSDQTPIHNLNGGSTRTLDNVQTVCMKFGQQSASAKPDGTRGGKFHTRARALFNMHRQEHYFHVVLPEYMILQGAKTKVACRPNYTTCSCLSEPFCNTALPSGAGSATLRKPGGGGGNFGTLECTIKKIQFLQKNALYEPPPWLP